MRLLLNLSISKQAQVSLIDGNETVDSAKGDDALRLIDQLLKKHRLQISDLDEVTSFPGPGSFTGLKVGAAIANTLNFYLGSGKRIYPTYQAKT